MKALPTEPRARFHGGSTAAASEPDGSGMEGRWEGSVPTAAAAEVSLVLSFPPRVVSFRVPVLAEPREMPGHSTPKGMA